MLNSTQEKSFSTELKRIFLCNLEGRCWPVKPSSIFLTRLTGGSAKSVRKRRRPWLAASGKTLNLLTSPWMTRQREGTVWTSREIVTASFSNETAVSHGGCLPASVPDIPMEPACSSKRPRKVTLRCNCVLEECLLRISKKSCVSSQIFEPLRLGVVAHACNLRN